MLVLSRKPMETIVCETEDGTEITIMVVRIGQQIVRVGIEAPLSVNVRRGELIHVEGESSTPLPAAATL